LSLFPQAAAVVRNSFIFIIMTAIIAIIIGLSAIAAVVILLEMKKDS